LIFFPEEAFNWQLHRIREIYCTPGENFEREYPYCTTADIDHFVQSMVNEMKDRIIGAL